MPSGPLGGPRPNVKCGIDILFHGTTEDEVEREFMKAVGGNLESITKAGDSVDIQSYGKSGVNFLVRHSEMMEIKRGSSSDRVVYQSNPYRPVTGAPANLSDCNTKLLFLYDEPVEDDNGFINAGRDATLKRGLTGMSMAGYDQEGTGMDAGTHIRVKEDEIDAEDIEYMKQYINSEVSGFSVKEVIVG